MERPLLRVARVSAATILLAAACGGEQDPAPGDVLESGAASVYAVAGAGALPPGREVSVMLTALRNTSGEEVVIHEVEPVGVSVTSDGEAPAEVVAVELAVRDAALAEAVPLGFYPGPRPAVEVDGACVEQPTVAAADFALKPGGEVDEEVFLVVRVRTTAPGTFRLEGQRVVYELDGTRYHQDLRDGLELEVREGAEPEVPDDQAACAAR